MEPDLKQAFGESHALPDRPRHIGIGDVLLILGIAGVVFGLGGLSREWTAFRPKVEIDLLFRALPRYALFSLSRGLIAYVISLAFTLVYGYWAAKDRAAGRVLVPLLDILQSIPVLGFMPALVFALIALFPRSNIGLELAAILMIFTGQAWNLTFSFYHSLRAIPPDLNEVATVYRFTWWQRLRRVELPFAALGLVWNSMMSMAGGWFFLMINEAFVLGDRDFRLPGIGSYMSVAAAKGDSRAMIAAVVAMILMIVLLDQLLWRPVVAWAQKFRIEESSSGERVTSWFLEFLKRSMILGVAQKTLGAIGALVPQRTSAPAPPRRVGEASPAVRVASHVLLAALLVVFALGAWKLIVLLRPVPLRGWASIAGDGGLTLGRVMLSTALGTLWALPAGLAIGLSPRLSRLLQPVVQVAASFPAPMLFPAAVAVLRLTGIPLGWGSILLMLLGTQWYILFNVIAGTMAVPADLLEAARSYRFSRWLRFRKVLLPAVFPYLVTGWVTAAGGAWNASIVAEAVVSRGALVSARGIGATIRRAAEAGEFPTLAASVAVMSILVVLFNRLVWRRLYDLAETRFSLSK